jgi:predicted DsbA family dithiol-disulfide isomerase
MQAMIENLRIKAKELGLPFGPRTKTYNSRLAQELGLWAEERGKGTPFHMAAFKAYFVDGLNLAKHSVLLELAKNVDLPVNEAKKVLTDRTYAAHVDKDWEDSRFLGVTAVPTFIMGRHKLVGAQSFENLSQLVTINGAVPLK